jgi:hypothetical protein
MLVAVWLREKPVRVSRSTCPHHKSPLRMTCLQADAHLQAPLTMISLRDERLCRWSIRGRLSVSTLSQGEGAARTLFHARRVDGTCSLSILFRTSHMGSGLLKFDSSQGELVALTLLY